MYLDLHCHTIASDGILTPTALVKKAKQLGFSFIAKTDHDNVDLTAEFLSAAKKYQITGIPGMEISSRYQGKSLHILGLGIDYKNKKIKWYATKCREARKTRGLKMVAKLKNNGWHIKKNELNKTLLARPHVALSVINHPKNKKRLLKEFGAIPDFSTFIRQYLAKGCPCYVPKKFYLKPLPAIKMLHSAGGLAIVAHPMSKTKEFSYSQKHLTKIIRELPFDGLEVYNTCHTDTEIDYLKKIAQKNNLLISAGSDYHGYDKNYPLGPRYRGRMITRSECQELLKKIKP
ncbi:PHP domain-containing protein [Candidatus Kuenenbacteria bacterium]|nr:PHP domain-containing protein [Candidatus Kuenenbacteria bacterium]